MFILMLKVQVKQIQIESCLSQVSHPPPPFSQQTIDLFEGKTDLAH